VSGWCTDCAAWYSLLYHCNAVLSLSARNLYVFPKIKKSYKPLKFKNKLKSTDLLWSGCLIKNVSGLSPRLIVHPFNGQSLQGSLLKSFLLQLYKKMTLLITHIYTIIEYAYPLNDFGE